MTICMENFILVVPGILDLQLRFLLLYTFYMYIRDKVFKSGPSKICGRQLLKNLKGYGLLKQTISLQDF